VSEKYITGFWLPSSGRTSLSNEPSGEGAASRAAFAAINSSPTIPNGASRGDLRRARLTTLAVYLTARRICRAQRHCSRGRPTLPSPRARCLTLESGGGVGFWF
jgi:hypothetical protein